MQFNSITEYFYKFYSFLLLIILIPILAFTSLYLKTSTLLIEADTETQTIPEVIILFATGFILVLLLLLFFFDKKIKSIRNGQGLRQKLEKYFHLTIVRYILIMVTGLVLAFGFYLYKNDFFSLLFIILLILTAIFWPSPAKVCNDLKLRGDEREMVYYKKDVL